ncbi:MAG: peptidase S8 [Lachnospira sp.]|nr:peptidase S8 [Lachnospira sp.]
MSYFFDEKARIGVAVLDTGIYPHVDFENRIRVFKDFVNNIKRPYDDNGHGTHVSGIIAGAGIANKRYRGVAPMANIIALKTLDKKGDGEVENVIKANEWILENCIKYNIRIVNISMGAAPANKDEYTPKEKRFIENVERLWDAGIVVVAAAGNNGPESNSITIPGVSKKVITVGNCENTSISKTSSGRGPTVDRILKPDIIVPGNNIMACANMRNAYTTKSGTSMSTPIVSGTIARMLEKNPSLTNYEIKENLQKTAIDMGYDRNRQGFGMLNINDLLN